jgi:hypothetical protein
MLGKRRKEMQEARNVLIDAMDKIRNGKMPLKTGEILHKAGHTIAQNEFAEVKSKQLINGEVELEDLLDVNKRLKKK